MSAPFCYIDHKTGDSDHMNAHIQTASCFKKPKTLLSSQQHWPDREKCAVCERPWPCEGAK